MGLLGRCCGNLGNPGHLGKHGRRFLHVNLMSDCEIKSAVTDFIQKGLTPVTGFSTQYNEMNQLATDIAKVIPRPRDTLQIIQGTKEHDKLEEQALNTVRDHSIWQLSRDPRTESQKNVMKLIDMANKIKSLSEGNPVRELSIRGKIDEFHLTGKIDGINVDVNGNIFVVETKTTSVVEVRDYQLRLAYHQSLFYHKLLTKLIWPTDKNDESYQHLLSEMAIDHDLDEKLLPVITDSLPDLQGCKVGDVVGNLQAAIGFLRSSNRRLLPQIQLCFLTGGRIKPETQVFEVNYDEEVLQSVIAFRRDFFNGLRLPVAGNLV